jgi:HEAT repeat protein
MTEQSKRRGVDTEEAAEAELARAAPAEIGLVAARYLRARDKYQRLAAVAALKNKGGRTHLEVVQRALRDRYDMVRVEAIECIVEWECRAGASAIAPLLSDRSRFVRAYAAWALGRLRARQFVRPLVDRLSRERRDIAIAGVLEALHLLTGNTSYAEALARILSRSDDHQARAFAANSLVGIVTPRTKAFVERALVEARRHEKTRAMKDLMSHNLALVRVRE